MSLPQLKHPGSTLDDQDRYRTAARLEWGTVVAVSAETITLTLGES